jgi:hypothetical protein
MLEHGHAADAGHHEIEQHERDGVSLGAFEQLDRLLTGVGGARFETEPFDGLFENAALGRIVIDDENTLDHGTLVHNTNWNACPLELARLRTLGRTATGNSTRS